MAGVTGDVADPRLSSGPVFVVGSMRSGSTMLRLILDSHPNIAIGGETGFVAALAANQEIPNWKFGKGWYEQLGWSEQEFNARLREFYDGLFRRMADRQGKPRWGEKTPFHTAHIARMAEVFPDAVFVGIVRHPGAVAGSLRRRFHYTYPDAVAYWTQTNLDMVAAGSTLAARFALCRYEDLVTQGEPVLRELLEHVGEAWSDDVLEHHRVQREKGAPRAAEGNTIAHEPIDAARADQWRDSATPDDLRSLQETAELARFFGYEPTEPAVSARLTGADATSWLATGSDLVRLRELWRDRLDFEARPQQPLTEADPEALAARLAHVERALRRVRSRRAVRLADAVRQVQSGRSRADLRRLWSALRRGEGAGHAV